ncbi:MAG: hypothetical protein WCS77_00095 [Elusimicrobiaceae bacterium]|jgi:hypothetical protein
MAKQINAKVFVDSEVLEAADLNQSLTDLGNVESSVPYDSGKQQVVDGSVDIGKAATPWGDLYLKNTGKIKMVDPITHTVVSTFDPAGGGLTWTKYTLGYATLSAAALVNSADLFTLAAGQIIHAVKIKHSAQFAGGAITEYYISVGLVGNTSKYAPEYAGHAAVADDTFDINLGLFGENNASGTAVKVTARSVGANLDTASQGSVDIWVLTSLAV